VYSHSTADEVPELNRWNPMEADYLSSRNNYSIDDEDPGSALHGYSRESKYFHMHTCIYTNYYVDVAIEAFFICVGLL